MNQNLKRTKKKQNISEVDINDAIKLQEKLLNIAKEGTVISKEDQEDLLMASNLLDMLVTLYTTWTRSKKKIRKMLKMFFGDKSEKKSKIKTDDQCKGSNSGNTINSDEKGDDSFDNKGQKDIALEKEDNSDSKGNDDKNNDGKGSNDNDDGNKKKRSGGGGRLSADDYVGANEVFCSLEEEFKPGKICPKCNDNNLHKDKPKKVIRLIGHAPVTAFKFIMEKSKCICGALFTAKPPVEFEDIYYGEKYGPSALASIITYKYIVGASFGSLEKLQAMNGVPIPDSTQANKIRDLAVPVINKIVEELTKLSANSYILGYDDTSIKLLTEKRVTTKNTKTNKGSGTAVVANGFDSYGNTIILYDFDYSIHAGDVVLDILSLRERKDRPLLISDGLNAYNESKKKGEDINCNTHARRKMVEEDPSTQSYVGKIVIDCYEQIYINDNHCKENSLLDQDRMAYHQEHSSYYFSKIKAVFEFITGKITDLDRSIYPQKFSLEAIFSSEPNDDLYSVAKYFLDRYQSLTKVLELPGVPLDTNYVERAIKAIIRIRRNSQFFENLESAKYSGNILGLLETTNYNKINAFLYIEYLLDNKEKVLEEPKNYLPWLYNKSDDFKKKYWEAYDAMIKNSSNSPEDLSSCLGHSYISPEILKSG